MERNTLRLKWPVGQTLGLALVLLGLILGAGEIITRTRPFISHFVATRRGIKHRQFELQLGRLETLVAREGAIECIFFGNSQVWRAFDPQAFALAYNRQTGQAVRCFNFGVEGMPTVSAGALAELLVKDYKPKLLIYGTDARDYTPARESEDVAVLLDAPWIQYRLGKFSVRGWFYEHSYLYRYQETLGDLAHFKRRDTLLKGISDTSRDNLGFVGTVLVGDFVKDPPDPQSESEHIQYYFSVLSNYEMLPENLAGLHEIVSYHGRDTQVIIVEMPVPETYFYFFGNNEQDYQTFLREVQGIAETNGVLFWRTTERHLIPDDGWADYSHLNRTGARIFSEWLGRQLAGAIRDGAIVNPVPYNLSNSIEAEP